MVFDPHMASKMTDDMLKHVLPPTVVKRPSELSKARRKAKDYRTDTINEPIISEAVVGGATSSITNVCRACAAAVGLDYEQCPQHWNKHANVIMDWRIGLRNIGGAPHTGHPGLAIEDKSPLTYGGHCTDDNIRATCESDLTRRDAEEEGFCAIILKVGVCENGQNGILI